VVPWCGVDTDMIDQGLDSENFLVPTYCKRKTYDMQQFQILQVLEKKPGKTYRCLGERNLVIFAQNVLEEELKENLRKFCDLNTMKSQIWYC